MKVWGKAEEIQLFSLSLGMKKFKVGEVIEYRGYLYKITGVQENFYEVEAIYPYDSDGIVRSIGPGGWKDMKGPVRVETVKDFRKKVEEVSRLYWTDGISEETIGTKTFELLKLAKILVKRGDV